MKSNKIAIYRCPACSAPLADTRCSECGRETDAGGVLDLVKSLTDERVHYDERYTQLPPAPRPDEAWLEREWRSRFYPINETLAAILERRLEGKTVLLLGNGGSLKELALLKHQPARLIVSDLSIEGVRRVQGVAPDHDALEYVTLDAMDLAIEENTIDLVYGYAFVHHLPDLQRFFQEVARVLKPGGRAIFMDDAYSPIWQSAKRGVLQPLLRYFHRRSDPSPEDVRATLSGGFREQELDRMIRELHALPFFCRRTFLHYLFTRASEHLPPRRVFEPLACNERFLDSLIRLDDALARWPAYSRQQIRLAWGFQTLPWPRPAAE